MGLPCTVLPEVGIDAHEELVRDGRPGPPEVEGDVAQPLERGGRRGTTVKCFSVGMGRIS